MGAGRRPPRPFAAPRNLATPPWGPAPAAAACHAPPSVPLPLSRSNRMSSCAGSTVDDACGGARGGGCSGGADAPAAAAAARASSETSAGAARRRGAMAATPGGGEMGEDWCLLAGWRHRARREAHCSRQPAKPIPPGWATAPTRHAVRLSAHQHGGSSETRTRQPARRSARERERRGGGPTLPLRPQLSPTPTRAPPLTSSRTARRAR